MISVSIVSHGHGEMVWDLVRQALNFPEVSRIILTINIPEPVPNFNDSKIEIVHNSLPKGFGANHNAAFEFIGTDFFCVLNPDIAFDENPFPDLMAAFKNSAVGLVSPLVVGSNGLPEDSMRCFLSPWTMLKRIFGLKSGAYILSKAGGDLSPDWVAGMFMLFRSEAYSELQGFDERYFMYCEDADISTRIWEAGYKITGCQSTSVIHNARRASRRNLKHFLWHLKSMARFFLIHPFYLPRKKSDV